MSAAALTLLLCGCSHKTEVRNKGFIRTIGCDSGKTQSAALTLYGEDEAIEGSGNTIYSAIEDAETTQGKSLFTGHIELLILNPGDIKDKLSVMIKNNRISPSCYLMLTPDSAAEAVKNSGEQDLSEILGSNSRKGKISRKNISAVLNDLLEEDSMAAVPVLKDGDLTMCVTDGRSISGILSEEESEGLYWLTGSLYDLYIPIETNGKTASFHVRKSSTRLSASKDDQGVKITTEIKINGSCDDESISENEASKAAAEKISKLCSKAISKTVIGLKADVIGIQKCISSGNIEIDKSWNEIIPELQFYYSIKIAS